MSLFELKLRGLDKYGSGHYKAPRGKRKHKGIDLVCDRDFLVESLLPGEVTKIGYPYHPNDPDKGHLRYVEVTTGDFALRYFYVDPLVQVGDTLMIGDTVGAAQGLQDVYPGITEHVHFEILHDGKYVDPNHHFPELGK